MFMMENRNSVIYGKNAIKKISCLTESISLLNLFEMEIEIRDLIGNPYDSEENCLEIEYTSKSGNSYTHPGFYYVPCRKDEDGFYVLDTEKSPAFRVRISPQEIGEHQAKLIFKQNKETKDILCFSFYVNDGYGKHGFLKVEPERKKSFCFQDGTPFTPIGQNVCWGENVDWSNREKPQKIDMFERIYHRLHMFGANWTRYWCSASWNTGFFKKGFRTDDYSEVMDRAAMIDDIIKLHDENDLYVTFVLFYHGMFNIGGADTDWEWNAFNIENPYGYLSKPAEFFTNPRCIKETKQFLRYIIGRYGYSKNIFAWELFNEVNFTDGDPDEITKWHHVMTDYIRKTDSHPHMVSTSSSMNRYPLIFDDVFDYINMHRYGRVDNPKLFVHEAYLSEPDYDRPIMLEESGGSWNGPVCSRILRHQEIWSGLMADTPATAMEWWWETWDKYTDDSGDIYTAYRDFEPASRFCQRIPRNRRDQRFVTRERLACNDDHADAVGYNGKDYAFLWIYDSKYTFDNPVITSVNNVSLDLILENGNYLIEWFDTWEGEYIKSEKVTVKGSFIQIYTPEWTRDIAVAVTKLSDY